MWITLRNGVKYRRPDGKPICWDADENRKPIKEKTSKEEDSQEEV